MSNDSTYTRDINEIVQKMRARGDAFAIATVVRTVSVTAAKPGAKAILNSDGEILEGWIGGGCARHSVTKAARQAIADGEPRLISLQPQELLEEQGVNSGQNTQGRLIASNMCPSKGSMDIFVEPVLLNPELLVIGVSPVALMLIKLAPLFDLNVGVIGDNRESAEDDSITRCYPDFSSVPLENNHRYIVVATQGSGDTDALAAAVLMEARHLAFVGSKRKLDFLRVKLKEKGCSGELVNRIKGPAGLDIGGVTPQEIAASILAEIIQVRRVK